jgi:hypothetical protein
MITELKEYHFTDEQIDSILDIVRSNAHDQFITELADQIEDQIVNHPTNS